MNDTYKKQVELLLEILPYVAKEKNFALHGGTAINLFHLNMPRLSIDIDLTYITFSSDRNADLENIRNSLETIQTNLKKQISNIRFFNQQKAIENLKLICVTQEATVKIEVNQINRGIIAEPETRVLCERAQKIFGSFCKINTVSKGQLWGGKINAALDRQHPRDLFDIMNLFNETGYTDDIKKGVIFFLLCGSRPFHELLNPRRIDQHEVLETQFNDMTDIPFSYEEFKNTRERIISEVNKSLTDNDKEFFINFTNGEPNWNNTDYSQFPAIRWKLLNIKKLKANNLQKFQEQVDLLQRHFNL